MLANVMDILRQPATALQDGPPAHFSKSPSLADFLLTPRTHELNQSNVVTSFFETFLNFYILLEGGVESHDL